MNILKKMGGWFGRLMKKPSVIAVLFAGILVAFGVPEPLAKQVGSAVGAVASAVEQGSDSGQEDNLPPIVGHIINNDSRGEP